MKSLYSFPWPTPSKLGTRPYWDGSSFNSGNQTVRVLSFSAEESHWSGELTSLHEDAAGRNHPIDLASRKLAVQSMKRLATEAPVLLDVGCSSGYILEDLKLSFPNAGIIGSDYIKGPLEGLALRMPNIPIMQFDMRKCPLPEQCVDGITCLNVLEHIDADRTAMAEIHRILRPGGIAHIEVPAGPHLFDIYDEHLMHHRRYRMRDLAEMAKSLGFEVLDRTHLGVLVYPAFAIIKLNNRRKLSWSGPTKKEWVDRQIRSTRSSFLLRALVRTEMFFGRIIPYPVGIRCVITLQKK